jgi:hypothetical protein
MYNIIVCSGKWSNTKLLFVENILNSPLVIAIQGDTTSEKPLVDAYSIRDMKRLTNH